MKLIRTTLAASFFALVGAGAFAATPDVECEASKAPEPSSTKSRAEVKAEVGKSVDCAEAATTPKAKSTKKRAEVKAETAAAAKSGELRKGENSPGK